MQEVARSTTATLIMLSNAPSKVTGLEHRESSRNRIELSWDPSRENDIDHYIIRYTTLEGVEETVQSNSENITLQNADLSKEISVAAVNDRGIEGWDPTILESD